MTAVVMRWTRERRGWLAAALLVLAACGGTGTAPRAPLAADPPLGAGASAGDGVARTELERAIAFIKNESYESAKEHLESALELRPEYAEASFYLGLTREKLGDFAGAEQAYKDALRVDPAFVEAAQNLAALYLDEPPRPDEAIAVLDQALTKAPGDARLEQNLGYAYSRKNDVESSARHYEAALAKEDGAALRFAYGAMLFEAKQVDRAVVQLRKALATAEDDVPLLATIGRMLGPAKAYADCVRAFDRAIQLKTDDPELYVRRGTCKHELRDELGARADYQAAIKVDPAFAAAHYYLGLSYLADQKRQSATMALDQAAKHGGDTELGKRARRKLAELAKNK